MPPKMPVIRVTPKRPNTKPAILRKRSRNEKLRKETLQRDNYTCVSCKEPYPEYRLECDHTIPLSEGGEDNATNTQTLCINCHYKKTQSERPQ